MPARTESAEQLVTELERFVHKTQATASRQFAIFQAAGFLSQEGRAEFEGVLAKNMQANVDLAGQVVEAVNRLGSQVGISMLGQAGLLGGMGFDTEQQHYNFAIRWPTPQAETAEASLLPYHETVSFHLR